MCWYTSPWQPSCLWILILRYIDQAQSLAIVYYVYEIRNHHILLILSALLLHSWGTPLRNDAFLNNQSWDNWVRFNENILQQPQSICIWIYCILSHAKILLFRHHCMLLTKLFIKREKQLALFVIFCFVPLMFHHHYRNMWEACIFFVKGNCERGDWQRRTDMILHVPPRTCIY